MNTQTPLKLENPNQQRDTNQSHGGFRESEPYKPNRHRE
jgi:hypothetical protein